MNSRRSQSGDAGVAWFQPAVAWGAAVQTARVRRRLRRPDDAREVQERTWAELRRRFAATALGKDSGITGDLTYAQFRRRVPLRNYEAFAPWIERMKRGEAGVLWPGRCRYYAVSSGTTAGRTKYLPVTAEMIAHFRKTGLDSLCFYAARAGRARIFRGRHLFLGGSTRLAPLAEGQPFPAWAGDLSGITARHLPAWVERYLYEPGREIAEISDWPAKIQAIVERTAVRPVSLLAGIPSWILVFAEAMRAHTGRETLREVWPGLECLVHGGVPVAPFATELQAVLGRGVNFHEVYPASEGFIAAQDDEPAAGLRLLAAAGICYEFLPLAQYDETRLEELGEAALPLAAVQPGIDYVLILTTPGGLCRYVIGDVVRFIATQPYRLIYVGRTRLQLSAFGEHVIEKDLTDALAAVCGREGLTIANFHVAPRYVDRRQGVARGGHEWWIEWKGAAPAVDVPSLAAGLDAELQRRNDDYEAKRQGGGLHLPVVRVVPPGVFAHWMRSRGKWGGQNKMPRCRSDREIADSLSRLARGAAQPEGTSWHE